MQILNSIDNDLIMMCEPIITLEPNENIDTFNRLAIQNSVNNPIVWEWVKKEYSKMVFSPQMNTFNSLFNSINERRDFIHDVIFNFTSSYKPENEHSINMQSYARLKYDLLKLNKIRKYRPQYELDESTTDTDIRLHYTDWDL